MALIKGGPADEQENAKAFIDFMCSAEGQNLLRREQLLPGAHQHRRPPWPTAW